MAKEELKQKCTERAKIFQQAMESCHSNNPMDCIEWFADRIIDLKAENEQIKNSDTLCKLIGEQKRKITELEQQIEKMKCCGNCKQRELIRERGQWKERFNCKGNRCVCYSKWEIKEK